MTHKLQNNYTKEILAVLRKFQDQQQSSQPGDPAKGLKIPRESDFGDQWDLITELPQDWENTLGGHKQNLVCTRNLEKGAMTPQETESDLPVSVQESLVEALVNSDLL